MSRKFANRAGSTLSGAITAAATSLVIQVADGAEFPALVAPDFFVLVIQNATDFEVIKVETHSAGSPNMSGITRNFEGTTGPVAGWGGGTNIGLRVTAGTLDETINHVEDLVGAHAASAITNTPAGNIAATTVQAAINELDTEKVDVTANTSALALKANLSSPALTDVPTAPTAGAGTNTTQLATTAFVTTADNLKANLISPALVTPALGTPTSGALDNCTSNTEAVDNNTTQLATTAYVVGQAGTATPAGTGTAAVGSSLRYSRQDHVHAAPSGRLLRVTRYTTASSGTWSRPADCVSVVIKTFAGGGGGGGGNLLNTAGTGGGGSSAELFVAAAASSYEYVVGAGGGGGAGTNALGGENGNSGSSGAATTIAAIASGGGGGGGGSGSGGSALGLGGSASGTNAFIVGGGLGGTGGVAGLGGSGGSGGVGGSTGSAGAIFIWEYA